MQLVNNFSQNSSKCE